MPILCIDGLTWSLQVHGFTSHPIQAAFTWCPMDTSIGMAIHTQQPCRDTEASCKVKFYRMIKDRQHLLKAVAKLSGVGNMGVMPLQ